MQSRKQLIHQWIEENRKRGTALLQSFVQARSTQGNEEKIQHLVRKELERLGLTVDVWYPDGNQLAKSKYFASPRTDFSTSPNVVGILKGRGNGRSLVLNGHVDVVPEGNLDKWDDDPYSGKIMNGKLYGRGATDMKGGNVSMLLALDAIRGLNVKLKGDVIFHSVIEEESGGAGTLAAIERGYTGDAALIPEPTNMKIFPKQQGSIWFRISVKGQSAHGGTRYEGVSAIEKSMKVIEYLLELEKVRNARVTDPLYDNIPIPFPINIGKIYGGDWPSSVADLVIIEGRMGVSPEETMEEAQLDMEVWLKKLKDHDSWFATHPPTLEWFGARWLPGSIDTDHDLMKILVEKYRQVLGKDPIIEASPWGTDGGLLTAASNIPSIVFGPGVTEMAHYSNEYIELDRVFEVAEILALMIMDWCGIEE